MNDLKINRVHDAMQWLMNGEAFTHSQSINFLIDKLGELTVTLAFVNNQKAIAKKIWNDLKVKEYHNLITSSVANQSFFAPSLAKDYISAKCSKEQYDYDLCDRCSATITHTLDSLVTAISALKEEMKQNLYQQIKA